MERVAGHYGPSFPEKEKWNVKSVKNKQCPSKVYCVHTRSEYSTYVSCVYRVYKGYLFFFKSDA